MEKSDDEIRDEVAIALLPLAIQMATTTQETLNPGRMKVNVDLQKALNVVFGTADAYVEERTRRQHLRSNGVKPEAIRE